jgi:DNA-binding NarL/FixJ family response regulator
MPLPTMSLRVAPEYHQLIRDIATALRTRPELAGVLRDVLQTQHGIAPRNTDVLQSILDRLAALEDLTAGMQPRIQTGSRPGVRVPADIRRRIPELRDQGMKRDQIARELGISTGTVSNYLKKPED